MIAAACSSGGGEKPPMTEPLPPIATSIRIARPWEARVTHVALDLTADFTAKTLAGTGTLDVERARRGARDRARHPGLTIERVTGTDGAALQFTLGAADPILGQPLTVRAAGGRRRDHGRLSHLARRCGAAVAGAVADGGQGASVSLFAGPGDPHAHLDSHAGQPGHPADLRRAHHRAARAARGDERRAADAGRRGRPARPHVPRSA